MPDDIKPVMTDEQIRDIALNMSDEDLAEVIPFARAIERAAVLADREGRERWISVHDRLPDWASRDDTPCILEGKPVGALLRSETVLVSLSGGGVRTDRLEGIEGRPKPFWATYGDRVVAWMPTPAPTDAQRAKGDGNG